MVIYINSVSMRLFLGKITELAVLIMAAGLIVPVFCQQEILGGYSGTLDRMGAGIAELGAGNTGTAREQSTPAVYWNPAVLAFLKGKQLAAGADVRSLDRNGGMVCVQGRIAPRMGLGLGLINRGDFNVKVYDKDENSLGTARPQDFGIYLGVGVKTSRKTGYGASIQWFQSSKDIGGAGDANYIGIINAGWYRSWNSNFRTAVVLRNLGLNSSLSADYTLKTSQSEGLDNFDRIGDDFIPKTLVAAAGYSFKVLEQNMETHLELLDFQLSPVIFDADRDLHVLALRTGLEWKMNKVFVVRTGVDRGNITFGLGYDRKIKRGKNLALDYALVFERGGLTFNPFGLGIRYEM